MNVLIRLRGCPVSFKGIDTHSGEVTVKIILSPSEKGLYCKERNLLPGSKFLPYRVDPFVKADSIGMQESKQKVTKAISLFAK